MDDTETVIRELLEPMIEVGGRDERLALADEDYADLTAAIEARLGLHVRGTDVTPANFATLGKIIAFVERKQSEQ